MKISQKSFTWIINGRKISLESTNKQEKTCDRIFFIWKPFKGKESNLVLQFFFFILLGTYLATCWKNFRLTFTFDFTLCDYWRFFFFSHLFIGLKFYETCCKVKIWLGGMENIFTFDFFRKTSWIFMVFDGTLRV